MKVTNDWMQYCRAKDLVIKNGEAHVTLAAGRAHHVSVIENDEGYILRSVVARAADITDIPRAGLKACLRNNFTELVSFRIDERSRMVGEAWAPKQGLTPEEFSTLIRAVASESDRFEYLLTGLDRT